jgi:hypothetical protein
MLKLLFVCSMALAQPAPTFETQRIDALIEQLGSGKFQERNAAQKELEAIGLPALEQLKKTMQAAEPEINRRAAELVRKIQEKKNTAEVLAAKNVHFKVKEMPVLDAVAELAKMSAYPLQVMGDKTKLAAKLITLDTGAVPFWKALDALGAEAGLVEQQPTPAVEMNQAGIGAQIQIMQIPLQAIQGNIHMGDQAGGPPEIRLYPRSKKNPNASYAGSVRFRAEPAPGNGRDYGLWLEASAEPRLQGFTLVGTPTVTKAIDDQGQKLDFVSEAKKEDADEVAFPGVIIGGLNGAVAMAPRQQKASLYFNAGDKKSRAIKELSGSVTAQVMGPREPLLTLDNVLKAVGESVKDKNGATMRLVAFEKTGGGDYKAQVFMEDRTAQNGIGGVVINNNGLVRIRKPFVLGGVMESQGLPDLIDAKGNKYIIHNAPARRLNLNNGISTQEITIIFSPQSGQGEPERLVLYGSRPITVTIPFSFENIPLE